MGLVAVKKPTAAAPNGPAVRKLKKGEVLFAEGESSRAMYFIKNGLIRIFKKKGSANIEIDTIHPGQVLGELAFLDGQPRSASGQALTDCELVEISGDVFTQTLSNMPDWLKILLKTVVGRLRAASNKIRQLETISTAYSFSDKDRKRTAQYVFLSPHETLKICTSLLLVGTRNGESTEKGMQIRMGLLQRYANQIMGVPVAKVTTLLDVLSQVGAVTIDPEKGMTQVLVTDLDFIEQAISYINEQNLVEPDKKADLTLKGFVIMSMIAKNLARFPRDEASDTTTLNLVEVKKLETGPNGKDPFRLDDFPELIKFGYAGALQVKSAEEVLTTVKCELFLKYYRLQRLIKAIEATNDQRG